MRLAIISDVHANLEALQATLGDIAGQRVDQIVCLGDIVGYNSEPAQCINLLRQRSVLCVAGNHDRAVTGQISTDAFSRHAARVIAWTRLHLSADDLEYLAHLPLQVSIQDELVAVHAALHPDLGCEWVRLDNDHVRRLSFNVLIAHPSAARICAFGHTHHLGIYELHGDQMRMKRGDEVTVSREAHYLANPGTVGQPRSQERRATYLALDTTRAVMTVRRVEYDAESAFAKTRKAGLLPRSHAIPAPIRPALRWGIRELNRLWYGSRN